MSNLLAHSNNGVYGNIDQVFTTFTSRIDSYGAQIAEAIQKLDESEIDQADLIEIQFAMGQYNAMLETASTVTKKITDMMSTLAQRSA